MYGRGWGPGPWDMLVVLGWLGLTWLVVLVPGLRTSVLRLVVVLPMVLGVMGYAVLAAVFPDGIDDSESSGQPGPIEWLLLSVGVSVALGILLGSGLALSPVGLTPLTSLLGVTVLTMSGIGGALVRRPIDWAALIRSDRLGSTPDRPSDDGGSPARSRTDRGDLVGYLVAAFVVLAAIGGGGGLLALAVQEPPGYTEFALLPEPGATNVTSEEYEAALVGESGLALIVSNHHDRARTYVIEVTVQRATRDEDGVRVQAERAVAELTLSVAAGGNATRTPAFDLPWPGEPRRVVYRLYRVADGEREFVARTHVWLNASGVQ